MAQEIFLVVPQHPLQLALTDRNSVATVFSQNSLTVGRESPVAEKPSGQGVWELGPGQGGTTAPNRILVQPFCQGDDDSVFWMRIWGFSPTIDRDPNKVVWSPFFILETMCIAASIRGPATTAASKVTPRYLQETERLCDGIWATNGSVGTGEIVSPGNDLAAHALIDLRGAHLFKFDFAQAPNYPNVTMNAFWRRA